MLQLLETGRALYVLAVICGLGILTRLITGRLYKRLLKESTNLAMTKNRKLKDLRQRAENTYRMNQGLRDSGAWLEHQLGELRFMGMTLTGWGTLSMQWTWLCLLAGAIGAFASYWYRLDTYYIVMYGGGAVMLAMLSMLFDLGVTGGRKEQLVASLQDYLENVMCPRMARNLPMDGTRDLADGDRGLQARGRLFRGGREERLTSRDDVTTIRDNRLGSRITGQGFGEGFGQGVGRGAGADDRLDSGRDNLTGINREYSGTERGGAASAAALSPETAAGNGKNGGAGGRKLSRAARRAAQAAAASAAGSSENGMPGNEVSGRGIQGSGISRNGISGSSAAGSGAAGNGISESHLSGNGLSGGPGDDPDRRQEVDYLKRSLEQIAASREKSRAADENWLKDLGPEEVQLIGDILKEYLA